MKTRETQHNGLGLLSLGLLALVAAAFCHTPDAEAAGIRVRRHARRTRLVVHARPAPASALIRVASKPGLVLTASKKVWVPGHWATQWVAPVVETVSDENGEEHEVLIQKGHYKRYWVSGHYR